MELIKKIKFLKWLWITLIITLFASIAFFVTVWHVLQLSATTRLILTAMFIIIGYSSSLYYIISILVSYKQRVDTYNRLYNLYKNNPNNIKKSIIYQLLNGTLCEREVGKQLVKDFNIKIDITASEDSTF